MTSTLSRTNSAMISGERSKRVSAQRYSIATLRRSIQPSSRSRCVNAAVHRLWTEDVLAPRKPIVGCFPACCPLVHFADLMAEQISSATVLNRRAASLSPFRATTASRLPLPNVT
jgi:hypothetical protein